VPEAAPKRVEPRRPFVRRWVFPLVSVPLLAPCFWHSRIQAGDLGSHVYNAWLAQLVARGQAPGLMVVRQATNTLFDLMRSGLNALFGMPAAERLAVSISVLVFFWGAFAFVSAVAGRRAWGMLPAIAMLAYGWVFHIGFFNFYLSLGLCFWAMALTWRASAWRVAAAVPILILAFLAHALPVAWALALMGYRYVSDRLAPRRRPLLAVAAVVAMLLARVALSFAIEMRYQVGQLMAITGADQLLVYDPKYLGLMLALLALWGVRLIDLRHSAARGSLAGVPFYFCVLTAAAIAIFPSWVAIPGYKHALAFIAERLSLPLAICVCALAAGPATGATEGPPPLRAWQVAALTAVALAFFAMIYRDEGTLNRFEDRLQALVAQLPSEGPTLQRVLNTINDQTLRTEPVPHIIDRVCVGRCYSYGNYEPSTAQFRVRVEGPNPIVAATYDASYTMQTGTYMVKERDLPLYLVVLNADGRLALRSASAEAPVGTQQVNLLSMRARGDVSPRP